jgi:hypothetical protein
MMDFNYIFHQLTPVVGLLVIFLGLRWVFRSTVGEAFAERIRMRSQRRWGRWGRSDGSDDPQRVAALEEQVTQLQTQVSELAERLDFAERMLAERRERTLGGGAGQ